MSKLQFSDLDSSQLVPARRIIAVLLLVSLLPLGLLGFGSWVVFGSFLDQKSLELQSTIVEGHAKAIDLYFEERVRALRFLIDTGALEACVPESALIETLANLNRSYGDSFVDIGVINSEGNHLAYAGPYDLRDKNYKQAKWFETVQKHGIYISDVFLGFREVPHLVIGIRADSEESSWILRVTINSERFDSIVHTDYLGTTGEAFIVNQEGVLQTRSRLGSVMDKLALVSPDWHQGVLSGRVSVEGVQKFQATSWLNKDRWMLVVQQDEAEVRQPIQRATLYGGLLICLAMIAVAGTTVLATGHLEREIARANKRHDELQTAFMRSAKLASIGELATGFAHEINNPLAIISAENTNVRDLLSEASTEDTLRNEIFESAQRCDAQVKRCSSITRKMLQFGRRTADRLETVGVTKLLEATSTLMKKRAELRNTRLRLKTVGELPPVRVVQAELEQVLVNLINNALYAIEQDGEVQIAASYEEKEVTIRVADNGHGIPAEDLERIFEPFFTTKPVGQGTGLGLSVCYGLVHEWGGKIEVESHLGQGTTFTIRLPTAVGDRSSS